MSVLFSFIFKKCNKLDKYIYLFFHYLNYTLKTTFSIIKIVVGVVKKNLNYIFFVILLVSLK